MGLGKIKQKTWLPIAAITAFTAVAIIIAVLSSPRVPSVLEQSESKEPEQHCSESRAAKRTHENGDSMTLTETKHQPCQTQHDPSKNSQSANKLPAKNSVDADLLAQETVAYWTIVIGIFTVCGVGLLAWTLFETRQMTLATRRIGEKQSIAYVFVKKAFYFQRDRADIGMAKHHSQLSNARLYLVNIGKTPAVNIRMDASIQFVSTERSDDTDEFETLHLEELRDKDIDNIIVPGEENGIRRGFIIVVPNLIKPCESNDISGVLDFSVIVSGKVFYDDVFEETYFSEFKFEGYISMFGETELAKDWEPLRLFQSTKKEHKA